MDKTYNGWKNRSTWNVAFWINNDEPLYRLAVEYMKMNKAKPKHKQTKKPYSRFIAWAGMQGDKTPDGIKWISTVLDYKALNEMMLGLI